MSRKEFMIYLISTGFAVVLVLLSNLKTATDMELVTEKSNKLVLATVKQQIELEQQKIVLENRRRQTDKLIEAIADCLAQLQVMKAITLELREARDKEKVYPEDNEILMALVVSRHDRTLSLWKSIYTVMGLLNLEDEEQRKLYVMLLKLHSRLSEERNAVISGKEVPDVATFNLKLYQTMQKIINKERAIYLGTDVELSSYFSPQLTPISKNE